MNVDVVLMVVAGSILAIGLISDLLKRLGLSAPLMALLAGVVFGPQVLGVLEPAALGSETRVLEELARITLSVSLVATGLQITRSDLRQNASRAGLLLTVTMTGMWLMTSLGAYLLLDLDLWVALLVGAILSPTDPVVASSLVEGPLAEHNLPRWLRRSLQLESGANDGLALVFVLVSLLVLTTPGPGAASIAGEIAGQIGLAVGVGLVAGWAVARLVALVAAFEDAASGFFVVTGFAMGLLVLGAVAWLGGTGVLASFVAGVTFSVAVADRYRDQLEEVQSALERLFVVPVFLVFGSLLPWGGWAALGWAGPVFALWVLVLRRPLPVAIALAPSSTSRKGIAFLGWYGPLGAAAVYYVLFAERYAVPGYERVFAACTFAIAASVLVHSLTSTPGVRRYGGRTATGPLRHPFRRRVDSAG